ncbi:hypothetical protein [Cytobacillus depressus]|nr:hypothetical protein [Cytobacillus depressus]
MKLGLKRNEVKVVPHSDEWHKEFLRVKQAIQDYTNLDENRIEDIKV